MLDCEIKGEAYRVGKLDAFKQFHVARRLAPVVTGMTDLLVRFAKKDDASDLLDAKLGETVQPLARAVAALSDQDAEYIIRTCLDVCQRRQGDGWARVQVHDNLMFQDIDMFIMLQLVWKVLESNLAGFFSELPPTLLGPAQT